MKNLVYFSIIASLIGASVISVSVLGVQLSLFRMMFAILGIAFMSLLVLTRDKKIDEANTQNSFSIRFMLFWLVYSIFSILWVKNYGDWLKEVYFIGMGTLFTIIMSRCFIKSIDIVRAFRFVIPMVIFHNILSWYEILTGNYFFLEVERSIVYTEFRYPVSTFGNTNDLGIFMLFAIFIAYICFMKTSKKLSRIMYTLIIFSSVSIILYTGSRAVLLGLIVGVLTLAFFLTKKKKAKGVVIAVTVIIVLVFSFLPDYIYSLNNSISNILHVDLSRQSGSDYVRMNLLKNGMEFLKQTYGFGTGAGNIEYWMENNSLHPTNGVYNIHNWWMEILVGHGLIIFVLYLFFYYKIFKSMRDKFRAALSRSDFAMPLGIMSIMTGNVIASISSSSNMNSEWLWVFWAIVISYQGIEMREDNMKRSDVNESREK